MSYTIKCVCGGGSSRGRRRGGILSVLSSTKIAGKVDGLSKYILSCYPSCSSEKNEKRNKSEQK